MRNDSKRGAVTVNAIGTRPPVARPKVTRRTLYCPPPSPSVTTLRDLLEGTGRPMLSDRQLGLLRAQGDSADKADVPIYIAGDTSLLRAKCVSIVGTREVTEAGWERANRLARELAEAGVVVVSGLAKGVDTAALTGAMRHGGQTAAVIGTPLANAYPAENAGLQEEIWRHHLLISPFAPGEKVFRSNFPKRNRVMAAVSDATVIVEASDTSGTLHQAAECQKLGRWLFIMRSVVENPALTWPKSFLGKPKTDILSSTTNLLAALA